MAQVHRFQASLFPVNAYIVDLPEGIVVVDSTLGTTDGRALRAKVVERHKPLLAVLLTHSHPDHYGAIGSVLEGHVDVPVIAVEGVDRVIRRDDAAKEQILRPMFGDEWPAMRTFPNRTVRHDEKLVFGAATFHVIDLGPGESPHDSVWLLESDGPLQAFVGDLVYSRMHAYLADGFYDAWLANLSRVAAIVPRDTAFHMGHGLPGAAASLLDAQRTYVDTFINAITTISKRHASQDAAVFAQAVTEHMKRLLPTDDLLFLMQLSIEPMRAKLHRTSKAPQ